MPPDPKERDRELRLIEPRTGGDLTLADLVAICWRAKWLTVLVTVLWIAGASAWLSQTTPQFSASMVIGATKGDEGLYNLATGSNLPVGFARTFMPTANSISDYDYLIEMLHSYTLAERLIEKHGDRVMVAIFGPGYETRAAQAAAADDLTSRTKRAVKRFLNMVPVQNPGTLELAHFLRGELDVAQVGNKPMHRVSLMHADRDFAKWLLEAVFRETSALLEETRRGAIESQIEYLGGRLDSVQNIEYRQALIQLLTSQEQKKILIESGLPFAAQVVDEPFVGHYPAFPQVKLALFFAAVAGLLTGSGLALAVWRIRAYRRERRARLAAVPGDADERAR